MADSCLCTLYSGSSGNATYIGDRAGGILVDVGKNAKQTTLALEALGLAPEQVRAILDAPCYDLWPCRDVTIGEMRVSFNPARHPVETNAIAVSCDGARFVFTGDSNTDPLVELFCEGADLLLADACLVDESNAKALKNHMTVDHVIALKRTAGCRKAILTHRFGGETTLPALGDPDCDYAEEGAVYEI